jgi:hypothetical protein
MARARKRPQKRGSGAARKEAPLSAASLKRATVDLEQALRERGSLEEVARQLAGDSVRSGGGTRASEVLSKALTLRDLKGGTLFTHKHGVKEIVRDIEMRRLPRVFVPDAPGSSAPPANRYAIEWISPDPEVTRGIGPVLNQFRDASKTVGYIGVANAIPATASSTSGRPRGYAQAALGIVYRPRSVLSRVNFVPEAQYRYEWIIETKHPPGTITPRMRNTGRLRLIAQRLNPVSGAWELELQRDILIWHGSAGNWGGPAPFYVNEAHGGADAYPGKDPGLSIIATKADTLLLWFMVETYVESDHGPVCLNKLEASVPLIWVWDTALT